MSNVESILEDLKTLPPDRLERAADYIHNSGQSAMPNDLPSLIEQQAL